LFVAVSAHSPTLIEKLPNIKLSNDRAAAVAAVLGKAFGSPVDAAFWEREGPITIVKDGPRPAGLQIYFDCDSEDEFGLNKGNEQFHELLTARAIPHEFHPTRTATIGSISRSIFPLRANSSRMPSV
jgi:hypothetical protein